MNKGFTLIELLAVLVILSIISLIVVVLTAPTIKNSKEKLSDIQIAKVEEAAKIYYLKEGIGSFDYEQNEHETCVNLSYLLEKNYIDSSEIINAKNNEKMDGSVKITYKSNQYSYEYQDTVCSDNNLNIICEAVTEATTGTIPSSTEGYVPGDEYMCEVKSDTKYRFFVVSEKDDKVNLIMERNICEDGTVATSENKCFVAWQVSGTNADGPVTATDYLNNATSSWREELVLNEEYDDEGVHFTDFKLDGKARMPYKTEISAYDSTNKTNLYLYDYLKDDSIQTNIIDGIFGYWSLSSDPSSSSKAYNLYSNGTVYGLVVTASTIRGVRPVISVSKNAILD